MSTRGVKTARAAALKRPGPVGGKRDENRRQKALELQDSALRLFLDQGVETTTIDDIVDRTGVAKGSFYRYFADKRALVDSLLAPLTTGAATIFDDCEHALANAKASTDLIDAYQSFAASLAGLIVAH